MGCSSLISLPDIHRKAYTRIQPLEASIPLCSGLSLLLCTAHLELVIFLEHLGHRHLLLLLSIGHACCLRRFALKRNRGEIHAIVRLLVSFFISCLSVPSALFSSLLPALLCSALLCCCCRRLLARRVVATPLLSAAVCSIGLRKCSTGYLDSLGIHQT